MQRLIPKNGNLAAASEDAKKSTPTQLSIAAAADLKFALDDLVKKFEAKYPATKVNVTYGSSSKTSSLNFKAVHRLISFFSAEVGYPRKLAEKGLGADDAFVNATGRICCLGAKGFPGSSGQARDQSVVGAVGS